MNHILVYIKKLKVVAKDPREDTEDDEDPFIPILNARNTTEVLLTNLLSCNALRGKLQGLREYFRTTLTYYPYVSRNFTYKSLLGNRYFILYPIRFDTDMLLGFYFKPRIDNIKKKAFKIQYKPLKSRLSTFFRKIKVKKHSKKKG